MSSFLSNSLRLIVILILRYFYSNLKKSYNGNKYLALIKQYVL